MNKGNISHPPSKEERGNIEKVKEISLKNRMSLETAGKCYTKLKGFIFIEIPYSFVISQNRNKIGWSAKLKDGFKRPTFEEFLRIYKIEIVEV